RLIPCQSVSKSEYSQWAGSREADVRAIYFDPQSSVASRLSVLIHNFHQARFWLISKPPRIRRLTFDAAIGLCYYLYCFTSLLLSALPLILWDLYRDPL